MGQTNQLHPSIQAGPVRGTDDGPREKGKTTGRNKN